MFTISLGFPPKFGEIGGFYSSRFAYLGNFAYMGSFPHMGIFAYIGNFAQIDAFFLYNANLSI